MTKKDLEIRENEKKHELFLQQSMRNFEIETNVWNKLEEKSISLIGFMGIITTLIILGIEKIITITSIRLQTIGILIIIGIVLNTTIGAILVISILNPLKFRADPNIINLKTDYKDKTYFETINVLTNNIAEAIDENSKINKEKSKKLKTLGYLVSFNFILVLLMVMILAHSIFMEV